MSCLRQGLLVITRMPSQFTFSPAEIRSDVTTDKELEAYLQGSDRGAKASNGALGSGGSEARKRTTISHQKERWRMGMATKVANKIAKRE